MLENICKLLKVATSMGGIISDFPLFLYAFLPNL
jgi:hypothetical protein